MKDRTLKFLVGPVFMALGFGLIFLQLLILNRVMSADLIGGGIGFILVGAMATFYFWDDRRGPQIAQEIEEEELSADEFDRRFQDLER